VRAVVETLLMVAAATAAGMLIAPRWGHAPVDLLYLVPVMAAASLHGLRSGALAAVASALAYNYFFTVPVHTFRIDRPADIVTVAVLLGVALVVGRLVALTRAQARAAQESAARNAAVAGFAGRLLSCVDDQAIGAVTCGELARLLECNAMLLVAREGEAVVVGGAPGPVELGRSDRDAAAHALATGRVTGRGSAQPHLGDWQFHALGTEERVLAALGLARDDGGAPVRDEQGLLFRTLLDQAALALDRAALAREMLDVAGLRERDRLRGALLSSVGHDLRTPLTAIIAAGSELREAGASPTLVGTLETEAATLERYILNLLGMARIEAGAVRVRSEPIDLVDAVAAVARDLRQPLASYRLEVLMPPDLPLVRADPELLHHCLLNLIDNAARYSPAGGRILAAGAARNGCVDLSIADEGPGLPIAGKRLVDRFEQIAGSDRNGGTGLGLAIVDGFARAMGAGLEAGNRAQGGAIFTLSLPAEPVDAPA
jgi:two-component system sensor histidine kinase KdpD